MSSSGNHSLANEASTKNPGIITIDGPAASGKSTVARMLAQRLRVPFVSSGLLYRAATLVAIEEGCGLRDEACLLERLHRRAVEFVPHPDGNSLLIDGSDRTPGLHTDQVDDAVSAVAAHPRIRDWVNARLREIDPPFVVEGRDMGTVVFPHAGSKFYLTAPATIRARRRMGERAADLAAVTAALQRRDEQDSSRLLPAADATSIDTGGLTLTQVVEEVVAVLDGGER